MTVRLYRGFLAIAAFGIVSLSFTFWSHQELHDYSHRHALTRSGARASSIQAKGSHKISGRDNKGIASQAFNASVVTSASNKKALLDDTSPPVVHILYTRFMQHQPHLVALGSARLELLKDFFLRSLQSQTTDNFLVVVRTDPDLDDRIKRPLLELLPNTTRHNSFRYLVVGTNENPKSHQYDNLRKLLAENPSKIWSGTLDDATTYLGMNSNDRPALMLETRLDSDDGLNREYLAILQHQARVSLADQSGSADSLNRNRPWKLWCAGYYLEWQYMAPWDVEARAANRRRRLENLSPNEDTRRVIALNNADETEEGEVSDESTDPPNDHEAEDSSLEGLGGLVSLKFNGCLSAGLSLAYVHIPKHNSTNMPLLQNHESLAANVPHCHNKKDKKPARKVNCLSFMKLNPSVLRARTPTSAGMLNILWDWDQSTHGEPNLTSHKDDEANRPDSTRQVETSALYRKYRKGAMKQKKFQPKLWEVVGAVFGLLPSRIRELREHFKVNMADIAKDNLEGQCSAGHSCKNSSQAMLRNIVSAGR